MIKSVPSFLDEFRQQRLGILLDDSATPERAVFVAPAHEMSEGLMNRMIGLSGGLVFVALSPERTAGLMLTPMEGNRARSDTLVPPPFALCTSVEAREGVTTGISAADRATTVRALGEPVPSRRKLVQPGHIFPVETREGGVLVKGTLAEGALDIVKIAGYTDAAVFLELIDDTGEFPARASLEAFAAAEGLPLASLTDLIRYRLETEPLVYRVAEAKLPTRLAGELRSYLYKSSVHSGEHMVLVKGTINPDVPILTRVQPEFSFTDVFGGTTPPSRQQLHRSLELIGTRDSGVLLYLRRPTAGQLREQVLAGSAPHREPPSQMIREYGLGAQILRDMGVRKIELLTCSTKQLAGLEPFGLKIVSQTPLFARGQ